MLVLNARAVGLAMSATCLLPASAVTVRYAMRAGQLLHAVGQVSTDMCVHEFNVCMSNTGCYVSNWGYSKLQAFKAVHPVTLQGTHHVTCRQTCLRHHTKYY